jgi:hypothetical protein
LAANWSELESGAGAGVGVGGEFGKTGAGGTGEDEVEKGVAAQHGSTQKGLRRLGTIGLKSGRGENKKWVRWVCRTTGGNGGEDRGNRCGEKIETG